MGLRSRLTTRGLEAQFEHVGPGPDGHESANRLIDEGFVDLVAFA
jgi:hypothetical protein